MPLTSNHLRTILGWFLSAARDLGTVVVVITVFQLFVLQKPFPNLGDMLFGALFVVLGLIFFIRGLEMGLFPLGEGMAFALANKGNVFWLVLFAFTLGFSTTVAEPALIAIAGKAGDVAGNAGLIANTAAARQEYSDGLRYAVALSVGTAIVLGVIRILKGWPIQYVIIGGYIIVTAITPFAPREIIGIAYDSGGVTTSTITVPLVTALGVGLATVIKGRNPIIDGFGLVAMASLLPMIFVMGYGVMVLGAR